MLPLVAGVARANKDALRSRKQQAIRSRVAIAFPANCARRGRRPSALHVEARGGLLPLAALEGCAKTHITACERLLQTTR